VEDKKIRWYVTEKLTEVARELYGEDHYQGVAVKKPI